ncbi:MAG: hypothetical protein IAE65_02290 [Ignavibacteria bacterium]|nr:hypothetical protein [Ignavibacteria bacterium]
MQKIIFSLFILFTFVSNKSFSQPLDYFDSANNRDNFVIIGDIDFKNLFDIRLQRFDNESDLKNFLANPKVLNPDVPGEIDFQNYTLILCPVKGVDCHSRFKFEYEVNDDLKTAFIKKTIIYGGCRAGGRRFIKWVLIPKLNPGYELIYMSRVQDDLHNEYTEFEIESVN